MLEKDKAYLLKDIIKYAIDVVKKYGDDYDHYMDFYLYSENHTQSGLILDNYYTYADYPEITENCEEIFPSIVMDKNLTVAYIGESFMDVISLAYEQRNDADYKQYVEALNYYYNHDTFMDLD